MKRIYIVVGMLFFSLPSIAHACSCVWSNPPVAFNGAKAVFIGQMLGGTEKLSVKDRDGKSDPIEAGTVRFLVEEVFKGSLGTEAAIEIASMAGTSCGPYGLKRGERYVVYAYADKTNPDVLRSGVCTRTAPIDRKDTKADLDFLRSLQPAGTGGNLQGRVWADLRAGGATPLPNVKVHIRGDDQQVRTVTTNEEGQFELKNLKPGVYSVEPEFPANYSGDDRAQVTIDDRGTAIVGFEAYINGKIAGRMVDKDGQGFNSSFLHLTSADGKSLYGSPTRERGGFESVGVPPGEYVLYLELQNSDRKRNARFYYPGTFEREEARLIKVGLGETVEGLDFVLPDGFKVRGIEGQVVWPDGQPAANVEVLLLCPQSTNPDGFAVEFGPTVSGTDEQGRFRLEGFTGEVYWIQARGSRKGGKRGDVVEFHSVSKRLIVNDNLKGSRIVLSEKGFGAGCPK